MVGAEAAEVISFDAPIRERGIRKGYKQTAVGPIPEDWDVQPLGKIATLQRGFDLPYRLRKPGSVPIVTSSGIEDSHCEAKVSAPGVVTGRYGTIGEVFYLKDDFWPLNTSLYVSDFHGNYPLFIFYLLGTIAFRTHSGKSGVPGVNRNDLHPIPTAYPPDKTEQNAIALALSSADALIESLESLVAKKRQIQQAVSHDLLSGRKRLPGFMEEWHEHSLLELAEGKKELFDDGDWIEAEHITDRGIRFVQTGNIGVGRFVDRDEKKYIFSESFVALKCKEIHPGDLLICRLADPAGRSCVLPDIGEQRIVTSVDVTIFRPDPKRANRSFLSSVFSTEGWFKMVRDRSGGTTHKRISRGALGQLRVMIPGPDEQSAIASILGDMESEVGALERKLSKARLIKRSMLRELLTGRVRLV